MTGVLSRLLARLLALLLSLLLSAVVLSLPGPASAVACTDPEYRTTDPNGMWFDGRYVVHNNMWNAGGYEMRQLLEACSFRNWRVRATADNSSGDGAVKSYPNVHRDWHDWGTGAEPRLSSFTRIRGRFASRQPDAGIHNGAWDIWLNGVASRGSTEVMIWTWNQRQVPAGSVVARGVELGGRTWRVHATSDNRYIAFVPATRFSSGTVPIRSMLRWLTRRDRLPSRSTLGQICYGFEIVSTGGVARTFKIDDFGLSVRRR